MDKVFIKKTTLTAIGDAIREQIGKSDLISPTNMPTEIRGIGSGGSGSGESFEPIKLNGDQSYGCSGSLAGNTINRYGDKITTAGLTAISKMFYKNKTVEEIPFDINYGLAGRTDASGMFYECSNLKKPPKINNLTIGNISMLFYGCYCIKEFPEGYFDDWDFLCDTQTKDNTYHDMSEIFVSCYSLRKLPMELLEHGNPYSYHNRSIYDGIANSCASLDEIVDLPNPHYNATWTSNAFNYAFQNAYRLKEMTFKKPDGNPYVVNWKNQIIDLSQTVGYGNNIRITNYNSGITEDKDVKDDATYQALKNDPDWYSNFIQYSRYNHTSAVNTINSLPDTSAYLAANGGTNTIKFRGANGSATDGGAISNLTEEEIAVATAKGWTVSIL